MQITMNGSVEVVAETELSIAGLLRLKQVESPEMVSVQLNGRIVERDLYETTMVAADDEVDFLYFMGGGR